MALGYSSLYGAVPANPQYKSPQVFRCDDPIAQFVYERYRTAKQARSLVDTQWPLYYRLYRGNHWPYPLTQQSNRARLVVNYSRAIVNSGVSVLTDDEPRIVASPQSPDQAPYAQVLTAGIETTWYRRKLRRQTAATIKAGMMYGVAVLKFFWDEDLENGLGDVDARQLDLDQFYIDPECGMLLDHARYLIDAMPIEVSEAKRLYPEHKDQIRPDILRPAGGKIQQRTTDMLSAFAYVTPIDPTGTKAYPNMVDPSNPNYLQGAPKIDRDWVLRLEMWCRDNREVMRTIKTLQRDPMTGQITEHEQTYGPIKKYPNGWRLITVIGGVVVQDEPADMEPPFAVFQDDILPNEFYSQGELEVIKDLQNELNKRRSQMLENAALMANPKVYVDSMSDVKDEEIQSNRPGQIVHYTNTPPRVEPAPPMPAYVVQLIEMAIRDLREVSGITTTTAGIPPKGVRSGHGMEAAQDIGNTRLKDRAKQVEDFYQDIGRILIRFYQLYYTTPRWVKILGSGNQVSWVQFHGGYARGDWDIKADVSSRLPTTRAAREQKILQLAQMKMVDQKAVLEELEVKDRDAIIARMTGQKPQFHWAQMGWPGSPMGGMQGPWQPWGTPMLSPMAHVPNWARNPGADQAASVRNMGNATFSPESPSWGGMDFSPGGYSPFAAVG